MGNPTLQSSAKPKLLVFIVAYNAEKTISKVVSRVPVALLETYETDVLIIDDASKDETFARSHQASRAADSPFRITALFNPVNQGYGGNQKLGYRYAIERGYDFVALIHGDGQYAPECLPQLLEPLRLGEAEAVFGSRMIHPKDALKGGMPMYKFVGNRILTYIENKLLKSDLSEFHSGYRIYATKALQTIPFERNSNDFHFDTEIIIQFLVAKLRIRELPIPTYYGDEICYVNGMKYAKDVVKAAVTARMQSLGLFHDPKFDCAPESPYTPKFDYLSPHTMAFERVRPGARVLDIGCAGGYLAARLAKLKDCVVDGIDAFPVTDPEMEAAMASFHLHDLNEGLPRLDFDQYDQLLMLDVIEHLANPEAFLEALREDIGANPKAEVLISTANIGFFVTRFMLFLGQFNYGKRGILDRTHTRLFTFQSFERIMEQSGFDILERKGVPGPYPLGLGDNAVSRFLLEFNKGLIHVSRGLFSYQIFLRIKPRPTLEWLLRTAQEQSALRADELEKAAA
jgi:glycosyltransferase involved in cell wall biosynthesis/SAM-dependent methyltransferase